MYVSLQNCDLHRADGFIFFSMFFQLSNVVFSKWINKWMNCANFFIYIIILYFLLSLWSIYYSLQFVDEEIRRNFPQYCIAKKFKLRSLSFSMIFR